MENLEHYSDNDFQNYSDGCFTGDTQRLEKHLDGCRMCSNNLAAYRHVWSFANNDLKVFPLKIDLAATVNDKIFPAKAYASRFEMAMYMTLILTGGAGVFFCLKFLSSVHVPVAYIMLLIPCTFYLLAAYKEIQFLDDKFKRSF